MTKIFSSKYIKWFLKITFVVVLFYFLGKKGFLSLDATKKALLQWDKSVPAMAALFFLTFLGIIRWQWLLYAQDIRLHWKRTIQLHFIGQFFNVALPGAVSGDFVKAFYIAHEVPGKRSPAFGSILFDRVSGLSALVLVSGFALGLNYFSLEGTALMSAVRLLLIIATFCVIAFYGYLFLIQEHHDPMLRFFRYLESKFSRAGSLTRIYMGLRHYHFYRFTVFKVIALSILIHITVCWVFLSFAYALGDFHIERYTVFIIVPIGLLVTAIPVMPAGIGTGHIAFAALFSLLNSKRGADIFSLFVLTQLFISAIGGIVYLKFRAHEPKPTFEK
ncbi:MAG: flippase-like domain-containing protein [Deltaproteobacteria bacterium]|nr:flippase-like domain-containing protein [Deltaproteobacteria bacterium]